MAVAGGASRSAAWFLTVMREIQTREDKFEKAFGSSEKRLFSDHLFAISSVSGGSLGAITFALNSRCGDGKITAKEVESIGSADLLKASASRFLTADLFRRLPFIGMAIDGRFDERNEVLEKTFEAHWASVWVDDFKTQNHSTPADLAKVGFLGLRNANAFDAQCDTAEKSKWYPPHLLLNGAEVRSGRRIITSTLDLSTDPELMPNSIDFFGEFKHDISLAAAVMNSARFPYVSPAGIYNIDPNESEEGKRQIIDGGYFENNGVETAVDLIDQIEAISGSLRFEPVPILLLISNNANAAPAVPSCKNGSGAVDIRTNGDAFHLQTLTCEQESLPAIASQSLEVAKKNNRVPELLAPLKGVIATRSAHAFEALLEARTQLCEGDNSSHDSFFHIGLPKPVCKGHAAPMNWILHEDVSDYFSQTAIRDPHVQWQLSAFLNRIADFKLGR